MLQETILNTKEYDSSTTLRTGLKCISSVGLSGFREVLDVHPQISRPMHRQMVEIQKHDCFWLTEHRKTNVKAIKTRSEKSSVSVQCDEVAAAPEALYPKGLFSQTCFASMAYPSLSE